MTSRSVVECSITELYHFSGKVVSNFPQDNLVICSAFVLHILKDHRCYGYIINGAFRNESETTWDFILVLKNNSLVRASSTLEKKLSIFARLCNILYVSCHIHSGKIALSKQNFKSLQKAKNRIFIVMNLLEE